MSDEFDFDRAERELHPDPELGLWKRALDAYEVTEQEMERGLLLAAADLLTEILGVSAHEASDLTFNFNDGHFPRWIEFTVDGIRLRAVLSDKEDPALLIEVRGIMGDTGWPRVDSLEELGMRLKYARVKRRES